MSVVTLYDVLEAFSPAFKSVDIRIVAAAPEEKMIDIITSIFLSDKSQEEIEAKQQRIRNALPKDANNKFLVLLIHHPFKFLDRLFERLAKGETITPRTPIEFRKFNPYELRVDPFLPYYLKEMEEWKLVGSEASGNEQARNNLWPILDNQNGTAKLLGYKDVYELISETLRIADFNRGRVRDFVVGIPMPARITDLSLVGSSIKIKTKKVSGLKDLQLNVSLERVNTRTRHYEPVWRKTDLVKDCEPLPTRNFCCVTNSIEPTNLRPNDFVDVELIHRQVPTLSIDKSRLIVPLQNPLEPFAKTLSEFCSLDLFRKRLLNPEQIKKPEKEFEDAVAWLLSLIGLSVIRLGRFEKLSIPETGYEVGSIDIIAYRENEYILLVDCDTSIPDEKKMRSMMAVKDHFKFIQDESGRPNIVSIIFSPKDCTGIPVVHDTVRIAGRHMIESILEKAMEGKIEEARTSLVYL